MQKSIGSAFLEYNFTKSAQHPNRMKIYAELYPVICRYRIKR